MSTNSAFVPTYPLKTAVLFLVFNRLDVTKQVFGAIRTAKPTRLYIAADGARNHKNGESEKVKAVRDFILNNIDWQCEIKTLFREKNLGCKYAVSGALNWFFQNEETGIVLEDDCLPNQSFFWFCEELLERYKDNMKIWHIGGASFQNGIKRGDADYYFSKYSHVWGWAGWANRWKYYDVELHSMKNIEFLNNTFKKAKIQKYWLKLFQTVKDGKNDTWDFQWIFTIWANKGLAIIPNVNMISNIGFCNDATHTTSASPFSNMKKSEVMFPIRHPSSITRNTKADKYTQRTHYSPCTLLRLKNKTLSFIRRPR